MIISLPSCIWDNTAPIDASEASVSSTNLSLLFGYVKQGALIKATLDC